MLNFCSAIHVYTNDCCVNFGSQTSKTTVVIRTSCPILILVSPQLRIQQIVWSWTTKDAKPSQTSLNLQAFYTHIHFRNARQVSKWACAVQYFNTSSVLQSHWLSILACHKKELKLTSSTLNMHCSIGTHIHMQGLVMLLMALARLSTISVRVFANYTSR